MYENKEDEDKAKEDKTKEILWSRYGDNRITAQRKYATGTFKKTEENWRPVSAAKPSELEKNVEEKKDT